MRLALVRHGETPLNREGRVQGHSNARLSEKGKEQAQAIALAFKDEKIEAIYSSPLPRAMETAQAIASCHNLEVKVEEGLKEMDVGEMDGLTYKEMGERFPDFLREWRRDASSLRLPGGETLEEVQQRAWASVEEMLQRHPNAFVVAVTHNFAIQTILCKALGMGLGYFRRLRQDVGSISILEFGQRGPVLVSLNERCHLKDRGLC